ncbi:MAG: hypothetical protein GC181_11495 [Bacteroidetes bacterium]|nr:hypothetical protein [Bacteroidota bacterium]
MENPLIKIRELDDPGNPVEFDGQLTKDNLIAALDKYAEFIFHDGYHELMIRRPDTEEYIAFEVHGLIFLYTHYKYTKIFESFGLKYQADQKLIYQYNHIHYRPAKARVDLINLIKEF